MHDSDEVYAVFAKLCMAAGRGFEPRSTDPELVAAPSSLSASVHSRPHKLVTAPYLVTVLGPGPR
jgi:hypothetical protein